MKITCLLLCVILLSHFVNIDSAHSELERFMPRQGGTTEIWRVTDNPARRDWANYQNTEAWSPDGRYICYESYPGTQKSVIHLYDLYRDRDITVDNGTQPRWAANSNWLFYLRRPSEGKELEVVWIAVDTGAKNTIGTGLTGIGETDSEDRWLFGKNRNGVVRVPVRKDGRVEDISAGGALGSFMLPNPRHPVVMFRGDSRGPDGRDIPFAPTRVWSDLEGNNVVSASPMIQRCHQAWTGDGTYHMHGNSQLRGRLWNEPFPSNLHYLSSVFVNDPCSCGFSGRWVIGSGNIWPMPVADLRSGDGRYFLKAALSLIHDSRDFSYSGGSGLHDNDAKGSPDGTKVVMSGNYDLKDSPVTFITQDVPGPDADSIPVESTDGFPESGRLSVQNEVIGYGRKTQTRFEDLTREMYNTQPLTGSMLEDLTPERRALYFTRTDNNMHLDALTNEQAKEHLNKPRYLSKGIIVTSFDARLIPEEMRIDENIPGRYRRSGRRGSKADFNSPLIRQRQTDVYIAVIRKPDGPYLRKLPGLCELIPGENHWEIRGYHLYKDGEKITQKILAPGSSFPLTGAGEYSAVAVEWSGLESGRSVPLIVEGGEELYIRDSKPGDFQWTYDSWLVNGNEVSAEKAKMSEQSVREIVHRTDGVIHREWYNWGQIVRRYDLSSDGLPIRRLFYHNGKLLRREYHTREGVHVSSEFFAPDGFIVEAVRYKTQDGEKKEIGHWWYEKGMPVKLIGCEGHTLVSLPGIYLKEGDNWTWSPLE